MLTVRCVLVVDEPGLPPLPSAVMQGFAHAHAIATIEHVHRQAGHLHLPAFPACA